MSTKKFKLSPTRIFFFFFLLLISSNSFAQMEELPSVSDIEGNSYGIDTIGKLVWMTDNLRVRYFNDSTEIPLVQDSMDWIYMGSAAYCWFLTPENTNGNETFDRISTGATYNYYAVESGKLCPIGWRIPTEEEWDEVDLSDYWIFFNSPGIRFNTGEFFKSTTIWFWTSTKENRLGVLWEILADFRSSYGLPQPRKYGASVRCVKDIQ